MNVMFMKKELNEQFIIDLSNKKNEPKWMLEFRLKSFKKFQELDNPDFGPKIEIDFDNIEGMNNEEIDDLLYEQLIWEENVKQVQILSIEDQEVEYNEDKHIHK